MDYKLIDNTEKNQYEFHVEGKIALIQYINKRGRIYLTHTEVPASLKNRGIGSSLVLSALEDVKKRDLKLVPLCPFVAAYIKRHPEWAEILDSHYHVK